MPTHPRAGTCARGAAAVLLSALLMTTAVSAAPPIRTGAGNTVPSCVSPERLMAFLRDRNASLDPRYVEIARWYKVYGDAWRVRWDYAFFQMVLETNYLKFRRGDGRRGDVHEKQNNFAGIGATGGGVAGERFNDIKTGVHAQIQHLVAYSGESVAEPVAKRTRENQDDIIAKSRRLGRPVTFGDLARRWAADRQYAKNIDFVAEQFRDGYCHGPAVAQDVPPPQPAPSRRFAKPSGLGGPKPQMLAGPETLPWSTDGNSIAQAGAQAQPPESATPAQAPPPADPSHNAPQVRTLWSRGKGAGSPPIITPDGSSDATTIDPSPQQAASREISGATSAPPSADQARPAGSLPPEGEQTADMPIELPTFRIAPRTVEPSKLGGPVEQDMPQARPSAASPKRPPPGTFVEIDPSPATRPRPIEQAQAAPTAATAAAATVTSDGATTRIGDCRITAASYGGTKTLLVQSESSGVLQLTALTVLDGFEKSMVDSFAKANAPGAKVLGEYESKSDALTEANAICSGG